jgi:hypothetical protein
MITGPRALLILHLSSLDTYYDIFGGDAAEQKADEFIDIIRLSVDAGRPVFVMDKRWPIDDKTMRPRGYVLKVLDDEALYVWISHDEGEEPWEPTLSYLVGALRLAGVDHVDLIGGWYDPLSPAFGGKDSGCLLFVERNLKKQGFSVAVLAVLSHDPEL